MLIFKTLIIFKLFSFDYILDSCYNISYAFMQINIKGGSIMKNSNFSNDQKANNTLLKALWWIFLFPIALTVFIVKNKKMNNLTKGIIIVLFWIIFLAIGFSNSSSNIKDISSNTQNETSVKNDESSKSKENSNSESNDSNSKNSLELSLGDTYNDNGVKITVESLEKEGDLNKLKIKIENGSSADYHLSMLSFLAWTMDNAGLTYADKNSDDVLVGKEIKPGENFESYIYAKSGDVSYITYSLISKDHKSNPTAKWIIKKDTRTQKEKDEESKNASNKARETFKGLLPYPSEVRFPALDYSVERVNGGFYQYGYLKYKNSYGNEIKSSYRMWYDKDGKLTQAEMDGKTLK